MTQLILQPCASPDSVQHFVHTIDPAVVLQDHTAAIGTDLATLQGVTVGGAV